MIVSLGSAGQISGGEYRPDTHLSQTLLCGFGANPYLFSIEPVALLIYDESRDEVFFHKVRDFYETTITGMSYVHNVNVHTLTHTLTYIHS